MPTAFYCRAERAVVRITEKNKKNKKIDPIAKRDEAPAPPVSLLRFPLRALGWGPGLAWAWQSAWLQSFVMSRPGVVRWHVGGPTKKVLYAGKAHCSRTSSAAFSSCLWPLAWLLSLMGFGADAALLGTCRVLPCHHPWPQQAMHCILYCIRRTCSTETGDA